MNASDIMTTNVVSTTPDATIEQCAELMLQNGISAVPVVSAQQKLVGIVSEGDLLHRAEIGTEAIVRPWWLGVLASRSSIADEYVRSHGKNVSDVMTSEVLTIAPATSLADIATTLETKHIKRLPVIDGERIVGIVSRANLVQALASRKSTIATSDQLPSDGSIRTELTAALSKERWAGTATSNVLVTEGVVEFYGVVDSESERQAARVASESIAGVRKVVDHRVLSSKLPTGA